jgi:hypothetical protein
LSPGISKKGALESGGVSPMIIREGPACDLEKKSKDSEDQEKGDLE